MVRVVRCLFSNPRLWTTITVIKPLAKQIFSEAMLKDMMQLEKYDHKPPRGGSIAGRGKTPSGDSAQYRPRNV